MEDDYRNCPFLQLNSSIRTRNSPFKNTVFMDLAVLHDSLPLSTNYPILGGAYLEAIRNLQKTMN